MSDDGKIGYTDSELDSLMAGESPSNGHLAGVDEFLHDLRHEYASTPYLAPGPLVAGFLDTDVLSSSRDRRTLGDAALEHLTPDGPSRTTVGKLVAGVSAVLATTLGKVLVGTAVAAATVGGVQAAHVVDLPGLGDRPATSSTESPAAKRSTGADGAENGDHGGEVSDFVTTTGLDGCEKGQATADLASTKSDGKRPAKGDDHEGCERAGAQGKVKKSGELDDDDFADDPHGYEDDSDDDSEADSDSAGSEDGSGDPDDGRAYKPARPERSEAADRHDAEDGESGRPADSEDPADDDAGSSDQPASSGDQARRSARPAEPDPPGDPDHGDGPDERDE